MGGALSLSDYTILAHVSQAHYDAGHLPGAIHVVPGEDLSYERALLRIPTDKPVLVYGCTGNWSSGVAALLNVLGLDAWFLRGGESSLWCSHVPDCGWNDQRLNAFPIERGGPGDG